MTSIEQDPKNEGEEFEATPPAAQTDEEYTPADEVDPLTTEANPVDVAEQSEEVPLDEDAAATQEAAEEA